MRADFESRFRAGGSSRCQRKSVLMAAHRRAFILPGDLWQVLHTAAAEPAWCWTVPMHCAAALCTACNIANQGAYLTVNVAVTYDMCDV